MSFSTARFVAFCVVNEPYPSVNNIIIFLFPLFVFDFSNCVIPSSIPIAIFVPPQLPDLSTAFFRISLSLVKEILHLALSSKLITVALSFSPSKSIKYFVPS